MMPLETNQLKHLQKGEYLVFKGKSFGWSWGEWEMWLFFKGVGCEYQIQHQGLISAGFLPGNLWLLHPKSMKKINILKIFHYLKTTSLLSPLGHSWARESCCWRAELCEGTGTSPRCPCPTRRWLQGTAQSLLSPKCVHLGTPAF